MTHQPPPSKGDPMSQAEKPRRVHLALKAGGFIASYNSECGIGYDTISLTRIRKKVTCKRCLNNYRRIK